MTKAIPLLKTCGFLNHQNSPNSRLFMARLQSLQFSLRKYLATGIEIALLYKIRITSSYFYVRYHESC